MKEEVELLPDTCSQCRFFDDVALLIDPIYVGRHRHRMANKCLLFDAEVVPETKGCPMGERREEPESPRD